MTEYVLPLTGTPWPPESRKAKKPKAPTPKKSVKNVCWFCRQRTHHACMVLFNGARGVRCACPCQQTPKL